ncbi:MAG: ERCC4 domain-containing protein [archaeon]
MKKILNIFSSKKVPPKEKVTITIDHREKNSLIPAFLEEKGFQIEWKQLPVADYIIKNIAIERKTVSDLKSSIVNKRIFSQLLELKQYPKHFLLVEGILDESMYKGGIHENAFRGFLLSIALDYQVPIIFTHDEADTAKYISVLAKKIDKPESSIRATKLFKSKKDQLQFILEGFPNIGGTKAKALIKKYKTLSNIFQASEEDLEEILGKRAKEFREMIDFSE